MAMISFEYILGVVALCLLLCLLAYKERVLDKMGTLLAFIIGAIIGIFGGILWLILLLFFLITSFIATRYKYSLKKERGVQEGKSGERHFKNVLANGFIPTFIALISYEEFHFIENKWMAEVAFITAISVAASDTVASELGVFSDKVVLITNPRKHVKPGTSGGISFLGQFWALLGAAYTAVFAWIVLFFIPFTFFPSSDSLHHFTSPSNSYALIIIPLIMGFVGCQIDSVLGATLENKGWLTNDGVNLASTSLGGLMAWMMIPLVVENSFL
jgi:uncharacterized protein (TIGR00297 family)